VTQKPVILRAQAEQDIQEAIDHYLAAAGAPTAALAFVDALEQTLLKAGRHPAAGSPRYAHELDLPGLRFWPLPRFPYLIFYLVQNDHLDVWRVLHSQRDIPAWMQPTPAE
jgi:toxin ParE1/3/4